MPELRHDPVQRRWVIVATERARRPSDFAIERDDKGNGKCPFCPGNEATTPPEIRAFRDEDTEPNTEGWKVRVVSNKFPALRIEGDLERAAQGQYDRMNGIGAHEVIIDTPHHDRDLADLEVDDVAMVLRMYRDRLLDLQNDPRFRYVLVFRNRGSSAGASLAHPHSQLIATPVTPRTVSMELESAREHFSVKERCIFCDMIAQELHTHARIVAADDDFVSWCPYASRFPFEVTLAPRRHSHDYGTMDDEMLSKMARHLKEVLQRIKLSLNDPPYNYVLHTTPCYHLKPRRLGYWSTIELDWHWHLEILPRLTKIAGFEWGTGFHINPTPPEDAARFLREVRL